MRRSSTRTSRLRPFDQFKPGSTVTVRVVEPDKDVVNCQGLVHRRESNSIVVYCNVDQDKHKLKIGRLEEKWHGDLYRVYVEPSNLELYDGGDDAVVVELWRRYNEYHNRENDVQARDCKEEEREATQNDLEEREPPAKKKKKKKRKKKQEDSEKKPAAKQQSKEERKGRDASGSFQESPVNGKRRRDDRDDDDQVYFKDRKRGRIRKRILASSASSEEENWTPSTPSPQTEGETQEGTAIFAEEEGAAIGVEEEAQEGEEKDEEEGAEDLQANNAIGNFERLRAAIGVEEEGQEGEKDEEEGEEEDEEEGAEGLQATGGAERLRVRSEQIRQCRRKVSELNKDLSSVQDTNHRLIGDLSTANNTIQTLQEELSAKATELDGKNDEVVDLNINLDSLKRRLSAKEKALNKAEEKKEELLAKCESKNSQIGQLQEREAVYRTQIGQLQEREAVYRTQIGQLQEREAVYRTRISQLEAERNVGVVAEPDEDEAHGGGDVGDDDGRRPFLVDTATTNSRRVTLSTTKRPKEVVGVASSAGGVPELEETDPIKLRAEQQRGRGGEATKIINGPLEPAFLRDEDYPTEWLVFDPVLGVVSKVEAEKDEGSTTTASEMDVDPVEEEETPASRTRSKCSKSKVTTRSKSKVTTNRTEGSTATKIDIDPVEEEATATRSKPKATSSSADADQLNEDDFVDVYESLDVDPDGMVELLVDMVKMEEEDGGDYTGSEDEDSASEDQEPTPVATGGKRKRKRKPRRKQNKKKKEVPANKKKAPANKKTKTKLEWTEENDKLLKELVGKHGHSFQAFTQTPGGPLAGFKTDWVRSRCNQLRKTDSAFDKVWLKKREDARGLYKEHYQHHKEQFPETIPEFVLTREWFEKLKKSRLIVDESFTYEEAKKFCTKHVIEFFLVRFKQLAVERLTDAVLKTQAYKIWYKNLEGNVCQLAIAWRLRGLIRQATEEDVIALKKKDPNLTLFVFDEAEAKGLLWKYEIKKDDALCLDDPTIIAGVTYLLEHKGHARRAGKATSGKGFHGRTFTDPGSHEKQAAKTVSPKSDTGTLCHKMVRKEVAGDFDKNKVEGFWNEVRWVPGDCADVDKSNTKNLERNLELFQFSAAMMGLLGQLLVAKRRSLSHEINRSTFQEELLEVTACVSEITGDACIAPRLNLSDSYGAETITQCYRQSRNGTVKMLKALDIAWDQKFKELCEYKNDFSKVKKNENLKLYNWMQGLDREGRPTASKEKHPERHEKLRKIGHWEWKELKAAGDVKNQRQIEDDARWDENFEKFCDYKKDFSLLTPTLDQDLHLWMKGLDAGNNTASKEKRPDRWKKLQDIGYWKWKESLDGRTQRQIKLDAQWDANFEELCEYKNDFSELTHLVNNRLYKWRHSLVDSADPEKRPDRHERLTKIGYWKWQMENS